MEQLIKKEAIENILRKLWKTDDGGNSEHRICYNKALQEVQCEIDSLEVKQEWSEYDQDMLVAIDCLTKQGRHLEKEHLNWLKSLKGKIEQEDTKQCTENDKVVDYILYIMNQLKGSTMYAEDDIAEKCVNWLKSLKSMNYHKDTRRNKL